MKLPPWHTVLSVAKASLIAVGCTVTVVFISNFILSQSIRNEGGSGAALAVIGGIVVGVDVTLRVFASPMGKRK